MSDTSGSEGTASTTAPQGAAPAATPTAPEVPARKSRAWIGWTVAAVILVVLLASCCGLFTWALTKAGGDTTLTGEAIAVIYIDSAIMGVGDAGLSGQQVTPEKIIGQLRKAEKDREVKAIVLRIDSPGGTASASQEIAMEVARIRKPVVVSVGDMAASGAYMIASQADVIVASPTSDIGSIGVILQVADFSEALKKLGIKFSVFTKGKYKDAGSPYRALKPAERELLNRDMDIVYSQFIDTVAKGRKMDRAKVEALATGWAWPGVKAKELGLVDQLGNYSDALREAARRGKIVGEPRIVTYRSEDVLSVLQNLTGTLRELPSALSAFQPAQARPLMR